MIPLHYLTRILLISLLIMRVAQGTQAQSLHLNKTVENYTAGGDGTMASQNDILIYTIVVKNLSSLNFTGARLYDNIPAGVSYIAGSTTLNGVAVSDATGKMPYAGSGGLINSPSYGAGILAPNVVATVTFQVKVTANGGNITNYGTVDATYNGVSVIQNTNSVFTNLTPDDDCSVIYQCTPDIANGLPPAYPYRNFRTMNTTNGTGGTALYDGFAGDCYDALTGAVLPAGNLLTYSAAIAYDKNTNRIYFVNNIRDPSQDLCYVDLNASPVCAKQFTGYPLETNTSTGYNINRMAFASDGSGYGITSNGEDVIQFTVDPVTNIPTITQLGPLVNDANNGLNNVLNETGGDIFADGSGNLYMIVNSSNMYKINPATRLATFLGSVNPFPSAASNAIAIDAAGNVYIGGSYQDVYKVNLSTMAATSIAGSTSNVYTSGDFTSCGFPVLASAITANKTFRNINGSPFVIGGDTVEYSIEVTNTGNINAAGVKLYDYIPPSTSYVPNSTTLNGDPVADVGGLMPYSLTGGQLIYSPGEQSGIIKPGAANKAVVKFWVKTEPHYEVCNQSKVMLLDVDGNTIYVNSNDPTQTGGQSPTCFYSDGVLPLNNLKFKGGLQNEWSVLYWSLPGDDTIAWFEIEYAENGVSFSTIGKVGAQDAMNMEYNYRYTDKAHAFSALRYYRLKIVQKGGSYTYSGIIRMNAKGTGIQVSPNPFDKNLQVQLPLKSNEAVSIRLTDFYGREVFRTNEQLQAGSHFMNITVPELVKGMYVLEIIAGNNRIYQQKLLKR